METNNDKAAPAVDPAKLTEDEQLKLMVKVENYMQAVDWAGTQMHEKCDAAEAEIFARVNLVLAERVAQQAARIEELEANAEQFNHPATQVYFRAGLLACREYMARFVEAQDAGIAASIRANWWPSLGADFGPPRLIEWSELTDGEFDTPSFRAKTKDEISPTQEALPIALQFLTTQEGK